MTPIQFSVQRTLTLFTLIFNRKIQQQHCPRKRTAKNFVFMVGNQGYRGHIIQFTLRCIGMKIADVEVSKDNNHVKKR